MNKILSRIAMLGILSACVVSAYAEESISLEEATINGNYQVEANWSELKHGWNKLKHSLRFTSDNVSISKINFLIYRGMSQSQQMPQLMNHLSHD